MKKLGRSGHVTLSVVIGIAIGVIGAGLIGQINHKPTTEAAAAQREISRINEDPNVRILRDGDTIRIGSIERELQVAQTYTSFVLYSRDKNPTILATAAKPEPLRFVEEADAYVYVFGTPQGLATSKIEVRQKLNKVFIDEQVNQEGAYVVAPSAKDAENLARVVDYYWAMHHR